MELFVSCPRGVVALLASVSFVAYINLANVEEQPKYISGLLFYVGIVCQRGLKKVEIRV